MNKFSLVVFVGMGLMVTHAGASSDKEKLEKAIEAGKIDKVRSLLKDYESKNPSAQERKLLLQHLANTASDVVEHRKETISLGGNMSDILAYRDREKARDLSLVGIGLALISLGGWYGKSFYTDYYTDIVTRGLTSKEILEAKSKRNAQLTHNGGMATLGALCGSYALYKGYSCSMQKNALVAAQKIESFLQELVGKANA